MYLNLAKLSGLQRALKIVYKCVYWPSTYEKIFWVHFPLPNSIDDVGFSKPLWIFLNLLAKFSIL